ncbi:MAG TPA: hypothetical protein GX525_08465 [Bacilli bacterium]|nr:hypothetical protein [Bacilli bacterium]
MDKKREQEPYHKDRSEYFMDVDRMINEGLAGGTVHNCYDCEQIEEARELEREDPPHRVE